MNEIFVTIVGTSHRFGASHLKRGTVLKLSKEPENLFDPCAISASLPALGVVGYVANNPSTIIEGTTDANGVYSLLGDTCYCQIALKCDKGLIAKIL